MFTRDEVKELQKVADVNDGHCDRCKRVIKIYRYKLNRTLAVLLKAMGEHVSVTGVNKVNFDDIPGAYSQKTQRTKMRLHGLIARYKEDDVQVANTWLITKKGWSWLHNEPVQETVVVFNNQVLGHEGGMVTMPMAMGEVPNVEEDVEQEPINTHEAEVYQDVRTPQKDIVYDAVFKGRQYSGGEYRAGDTYTIHVSRLEMGKPVIITEPYRREYHDIAAFQRDWKIVT